MNLFLCGPEPALDDTMAIGRLKTQAKISIETDMHLTNVKDSMIASMFYFELDEVLRLEGGAYSCSGIVLCRLNMDIQGLKRLYKSLTEASANFVVANSSFACVDSMPENIPAFRRDLDFIVRDMDSVVQISVNNVTTEPTPISGVPVSLREMVATQCLDIPFGCVDHRETEKPLPDVPSKRKLDRI